MITYLSMSTRIPMAFVLSLAIFAPAPAQWLNVPTEKAALTAPAPRKADKPDLSGVWQPSGAKYLINIAADFKPGELPIQPWAEALTNERKTFAHADEESDVKCLPPGVPKIFAAPNPFKIIQESNEVVILYETFGIYRQIFMDGRQPRKNPVASWSGYSVGKWDGDTLVVDSTGFNGETWLDKMGHPTSDALHVTERYRRVDFGHLEIQSTIDDPKVYTKPWTVTEVMQLHPGDELMELVCENEKDVDHMHGKK